MRREVCGEGREKVVCVRCVGRREGGDEIVCVCVWGWGGREGIGGKTMFTFTLSAAVATFSQTLPLPKGR